MRFREWEQDGISVILTSEPGWLSPVDDTMPEVAWDEFFLIICRESVSNSLIRPCREETHLFHIRAQVPFVGTSKANGLFVDTYQGDLTMPNVRVACKHTSQLG